MHKFLISLVGATGIGKTGMSIHLANYFKAPVISSDSRQFYKEMTIGTAVPSKDELASAKHYFIQNRSIKEDYSVGDFEKEAVAKIEELFKEINTIVMVGGSGLYTQAVLEGLDHFPSVRKEIRKDLIQLLEKEGLAPLQEHLRQLDSESYNSIELSNPHRVIRALEICIGTGKPFSTFKNKKKTSRTFKTIKIGLTASRELVYQRINQRVDQMVQKGLLNEAKKLFKYRHLNALQTVGYRELFSHLEGDFELDFAIEEIKKNTRRFAKRQETWNKKDLTIKWFDYSESPAVICKYIEHQMQS